MFCCCTDKDAITFEHRVEGPGQNYSEDAVNVQVQLTPEVSESLLSDILHDIDSKGAHVNDLAAAKQSLKDSRKGFSLTKMAEQQAERISPLRLNYVEFKVDVGKDSKHAPIGLELDAVGGLAAMVVKVVDGSISQYNKRASPERRVKVGDFVIGVNGISGDTNKMARLCMEEVNLELFFKRVESFYISLDKGPTRTSLGLALDYLETGMSLHVRQINKGLVQDWNRMHAGREVQSCDRIVSINGYRGHSHKLLELVANTDVMELEIVRPSYSR